MSSIPNKFPDGIMNKLRGILDLEYDDTSKDDEINQMSNNEAFKNVLLYEGYGNNDYIIKTWILEIYGVNLDEMRE